jgi:hypothetical protein
MRHHSFAALLVPLAWFCTAMVVSIHKAICKVNVQLYKFTLSLLVGYLSALVACAVVDRHPTSSMLIRKAL